MPKYRLLYFNVRGRGEPIRWIFIYAGQEFVDDRFEATEKWKDIKPTTPYGKVPVLYVDEKPICSTVAICSYLAQVFGLTPSNPMDAALCHEIVDVLNDLVIPVGKIAHARKDNKTEEAEKLTEEVLSSILPPAAKGLTAKLSGKQYFTGDKITWGDLYVGCFLSALTERLPGSLDKYPELRSFRDKISNLPPIAKWIKERPQTSM